MTASDIIRAVMRDRWERNFVIPNYTPRHWFECDVFEVTRAGFFREYEVKLSRSDFFADRAKVQHRWEESGGDPGCSHTMTGTLAGLASVYTCRDCGMTQTRLCESKHDRLAKGDSRGPSRFWFVAPLGLLEIADVPPWAGLIEVLNRGLNRPPGIRYACDERVKAPVLHRAKVELAVERDARDTCYWRMHRLMRRAQ
jgi:hypothetical protein